MNLRSEMIDLLLENEINKEKLREAQRLLGQVLREPTPTPTPRVIVQERYFRVVRTRYDSDFLKLQPFYGSPRDAAVRIVMEYDTSRFGGSRVVDFEIMK